MPSYSKEYEQYAIFALERFLVETKHYSEYDAHVKVRQDYEEVKKEYNETSKTENNLC